MGAAIQFHIDRHSSSPFVIRIAPWLHKIASDTVSRATAIALHQSEQKRVSVDAETVSEVVITVQAYCNDSQRQETKDPG